MCSFRLIYYIKIYIKVNRKGKAAVAVSTRITDRYVLPELSLRACVYTRTGERVCVEPARVSVRDVRYMRVPVSVLV